MLVAYIAYIGVAIILTRNLVRSARMKLTRNPRAVSYLSEALGVPLRWFPGLAAAELLGAVGVLVGIVLPAIGIAAAAGVVLYFVLAIGFHLKAGDRALRSPGIMLALGIAALLLRLLA